MSEIKELYDFLKKIGTTDDSVLPCKVAALNPDDTIDVNVGGVIYHDVRLRANNKANDKGLLIKPAIGSDVLVGKIGDEKSSDYAVLMYSQVDEQQLEIDTVKLLITKNGFELTKGSDTLWQGMKLFIEAVEKIVVLQGTNPDRVKLLQAKTKIKNLLNGT